MQDIEQAIRERAYQLWIESGYQEGNAESQWLAAQREVLGAALGEIGRVAAAERSSKPAKQKPRAPRTKKHAA